MTTYFMLGLVVLLTGLFSKLAAAQSEAELSNELTQTYAKLHRTYAQPPNQWPAPATADGRTVPELAPLPPLANPPPDKLVKLGKQLFHDPILSRDNTVSCASCHESRLVFSDRRRSAVGINNQTGKRNTQAIFGMDLWQTFFWDGRANTAEHQALMPIVDVKEMASTIPGALARLRMNPDYVAHFGSKESITPETLSAALVAFQRTLRPPRSRFMQFIEAAYSAQPENVANAVELLSNEELHGLHLFRTKALCMTCHNGALMSDNQFHVTGFHYYQRQYHDIGRFEVTQQAKDSGAFRTPSLWAISQTGPWMHNGILSSLHGIVNQYNAGGPRPKPKAHQQNDPNFPRTTDLLIKLNLSEEERIALVKFLETL